MKHTQGNWNVGTAAGGSVCVRENGRCNAEIAIICTAEGRTVKEVKANAALIAEAGTVHNKTGYAPRQLAEQKKALLDACEALVKWNKGKLGGAENILPELVKLKVILKQTKAAIATCY